MTTTAAELDSILCISADDRGALIAEVDRVLRRLDSQTPGDLPAVIAEHDRRPSGRHRLAVLGKGPAGLSSSLRKARERLTAGGRDAIRVRGTMYYGSETNPSRTAFLFPGQGSQYPGMLARLAAQRPRVQSWFDALDAAYGRAGAEHVPSQILATNSSSDDRDLGSKRLLFDMEYGTQLGLVASLALFETLESLGIHADMIVGHSNGEHAALAAGGVLEHDSRDALCDYLCKVGRMGRSLAAPPVPESMVAVSGLNRGRINSLLKQCSQGLFLAMDNCPSQFVIAGAVTALETIREPVGTQGGVWLPLPFERAYHTPLFSDWSVLLRGCYGEIRVERPRTRVYSCMTCFPFPDDREEVLSLTAKQWSSPVRFREIIERLYADGARTFVEVGPDDKLTAFVNDTLRGRPHLAVSASSRYVDDLAQLRILTAELYARGLPVRLDLQPPTAPLRQGVRRTQSQPPSHAELIPADKEHITPALLELLTGHKALMDEARSGEQRVLTRLRQTVPSAAVALTIGSERSVAATPVRRPSGLLGEIRVSGTRLTGRRRFDRQLDRFVDDHSLGRRTSTRSSERFPLPVLPFTLSMAIAAEAARGLVGGKVVTRLTELRAHRWLALDRGLLDLELQAERRGAGGPGSQTVRVRLYATQGTQRSPAFEATVQLDDTYPESAPARPTLSPTSSAGPGKWTVEEFYNGFAFHGPSFRPLRRIESLLGNRIAAELETTAIPGLEFDTLDLDPAALDGTGQLVALWLLEQGHHDFGIFPFAVDSLTLYTPTMSPGHRLRLSGSARLDPAGWTEANFELTDPGGRAVARMDGLRQRLVHFPPAFARLMLGHDPESAFLGRVRAVGADLAVGRLRSSEWGLLEEGGGIWSRVLAHLTLTPEELDDWYRAGGLSQPPLDWLLKRVVAKETARGLMSARGLGLSSADLTIEEGKSETIAIAAEIRGIEVRLQIDRSGERILAVASTNDEKTRFSLDRLRDRKPTGVRSAALLRS